jgi:hypothetical protein
MNKILIITGFYKVVKDNKINYYLSVFGQFGNESVQYIKDINLKDSNYNHVETTCRNIYCKYFNTDLYNIVSNFNVKNVDYAINFN